MAKVLIHFFVLILLILTTACGSKIHRYGRAELSQSSQHALNKEWPSTRPVRIASDSQPVPKLVSMPPREATPTRQEVFESTDDTDPGDPFPTLYFPFNSWEISQDEKNNLTNTADWLTKFSRYRLMVEGHTDIRGTESYNLVLGYKRARAVKEYLADLGIDQTRIKTLSYGKSLLLCEVDNEESCHRYNRRATLLIR